jgi:hypothetical protein
MASDERLCGKCGIIFKESFNLGMLECDDLFYTDDRKTRLSYPSDHREISTQGAKQRTTLNWQDWIWTFEDNVHVQTTIFKKLPRQPKQQAIVDIDKYNYLLSKHEKRLVEGERKMCEIPFFEMDDEGSFSYESLDDESEEEGLEFSYDFGPMKQVCISRFDWEKKFSVIQRIKEYDDNEIIKRRSHSDVIYYWNTEEYQQNPDKRLLFKRKMASSPFV